MSKDARTQHDADGVDPHRYYDAREFCRRLSISRIAQRRLITAAISSGICYPNGHSVIGLASVFLDLLIESKKNTK